MIYITIILCRESRALAQGRFRCRSATYKSCRRRRARKCRPADPGWMQVTAWIDRRRRRFDTVAAADDDVCPDVAAASGCCDRSKPISPIFPLDGIRLLGNCLRTRLHGSLNRKPTTTASPVSWFPTHSLGFTRSDLRFARQQFARFYTHIRLRIYT